jgi:diketogulonate reductase-like aldo/keto reductase
MQVVCYDEGMRTRPFGATGVQLPVLGQGTWNMERDPKGSAAALRRGVELGLTHVDTAEMYGDGRVEEIVGEALRGLRDRVFLASKVLPSNASFEGARQACERSLRRLGTDRLDLYLLHWAGSHPLEETLRAFDSLQREGKILHYGVSNFDMDELGRATTLAGPGRIACNQVLYHLRERTIEHALVPACESQEVAVVAYSPLGGDLGFKSAKALDDLAKAKGATSRQLALAFLMRKRHVFALVKASSTAHVEENAKAAGLTLSAPEIAAIDRAFPAGPWRGLATL